MPGGGGTQVVGGTGLRGGALALYKGDLLIEDPYEDWLTARRESLRAVRHNLLFKLSLVYEARGQYLQSIERLQEIVTLDSSNEEVHRRLMRIYALTGDRQRALRQFQQCCTALGRELDAPPEQATQKLHVADRRRGDSTASG